MDYQSFQPNPPAPQMPQEMLPAQKTFTPKFVGVIVGLLVLSGVASAGLWFWGDNNVEIMVPTFTPRGIDETAGWQTYRNDKYEFEFRYPKGWSHKDVGGDWLDSVLISSPLAGGEDSVKIQFSASDKPLGVSFSAGKDIGPDIVAGIPWRRIQFNDGVPGQSAPYDSVSFELERNSNFYTITVYPISTLEIDSVDRIFSTFKFIDSNTNVICAQDAKQCLDGSYVSRTGPNCEFVACPGDGSLTGHVTIGPNCPVEQEGVSCTPSPEAYVAHEIVVLSGQKEITRFHADSSGNYRSNLSPGTYTITTAKTGFGYMSKDLPKNVIIKNGETVTLDIDIDTGIR